MEGQGNLPPQISAEAEQLIHAVDVALSPAVSTEERNQAYNVCERFKEESPLCAIVGLQLAASARSPTIRHFGLQLVEHCIKFRWKDMHPQEKLSIKDSVWKLMGSGTDMNEPSYIKDGTARLVVEMVKREWPQQWPNFLQELTDLSQCGKEYQTELVLLVLLRLAEDVAVFQSVDAVRRRDLQQGLTANMAEIFDFLSRLLRVQVTAYHERKLIGSPTAQFHCRLALSVIAVFQSHVEWVSINHIMAHEGQLLVLFCTLLSDENFRLPAAECLLQIVSRKGPAKERTPLLILFNQGAIASMLESAQLASAQPLTEVNYNFLKRLTEALVGMGTQLCSLYGKEPEVTKPDTLAMYLQAVLALTRHQSLSINQTAATLWVALFKHDRLNIEPELLAVIEPWIAIAARKFVKTSVCAYNAMDFDSDEEFTAFHQRLRSELIEAVRLATVLAPSVTFSYAHQWLLSQLDNANSILAEWEALALFLDAVACKAKEAPAGPQLLERCLTYQSSDPSILSELLSCISALFVYVQHDPQRLLQPVLNRIFSSVLFSGPGQSKENRTKIVRNVRRHACSLLVKISMQHPGLLVQQFEYLKSNIDRLSKTQDDSQLSRMEVLTLQEALFVISNQFTDFQMKCDLIGEIIRPAAQQWTAMSPAFNSAKEFLSFIGLDRPLPEPSVEDVHGRNRSELLASTSVFLAVLKRCRTSIDPLKGHPAAQHLAPLLFDTFRLARVLHQLWEPEAQTLLSPGYAKAHDLLESEIVNILAQGGMSQSGMPACISQLNGNVQKQQSPLERVQNFLAQIHNNVFVMLGSFGETLGEQFYATPGLAVAVAGTTCGHGMEYIPDCRLRTVVKVFCRPFIISCPAHLHQSVILPFLAHFLPAMLQRLASRWQQTMQQQRDENQANLQEILCDVIVRLATRDYIELLKIVILTMTTQFQGEENDEMMDAEGSSSASQVVASVSELGKTVLSEPSLCGYLLQFLLSALWWPDSGNSLKAANILESIVKYWAGLLPRNSAHFPSSEVACLCLSHLLNGIQLLGQHDANLSALIHLGVLMYDTFLPIYPAAMSELMMRNAGCSREDADQYQDKASSLAAGGGQKINQKMERSKRELFRKMTTQIVGQHLADLFRKPVQLASLPKMGSLKPRPKPDAINLADAGLADLFIQE